MTVGFAVAALIRAAPAVAGASVDVDPASGKVHLLDIPYVPQSEALCGGAALAMVQRYWGKSGVLAEDFADLLEPGGAGIRTGALVQAAATDGWTALALPGTRPEIQEHLAHGRPIIALIQVRFSHHYVVLASWTNGWVILHDPSVGPFRAVPEDEFAAAWLGGARWSLLVLPPPAVAERSTRVSAAYASPPPAARDACDDIVDAGVLLARQGDRSGAEREFLAAQLRCPDSAAPLREQAGLRFLVEDWMGAASLARSALALDPEDELARRLLAASRFLGGDEEGALAAWNLLSEPRIDLTRIQGLERVRYSVVATQLGLPTGLLLTPSAVRQARRRLAEVPARSESRLSLQPAADGVAQLDVALLEHPPVLGSARDVGGLGVRALVGREISFDVASPTGNGELWSARWRWWQNRPSVSVELAIPAGGHPGVWRLAAFRERQAYAIAASPTELIREDRRRTALSFSDWLGPNFRLEVGGALDTWVGRGTHVSLEGSVETRWMRDDLALRASMATWVSGVGSTPFGAGDLSARWSSNGLERRDAWRCDLGISTATPDAPLDLWAGAGTGFGRSPLLRAHPLLDGGVVRSGVFGRTLAHATLERQMWPWTLGPVQLGWALFVDGARSWGTARPERIRFQVDGGAGLRLRGLGRTGQLRIDVASGLRDASSAVSVAWQIP